MYFNITNLNQGSIYFQIGLYTGSKSLHFVSAVQFFLRKTAKGKNPPCALTYVKMNYASNVV